MVQRSVVTIVAISVGAQYVGAFRRKDPGLDARSLAEIETSGGVGLAEDSDEMLEPVKATYVDTERTVQLLESKAGLDFISYLYKAALHMPKAFAPRVDEYMTELLGPTWREIVTDPEWKLTKAQRGMQKNRMFAVKLSTGGVLLYSPININTPGVKEAVAEMGEVNIIICPCDGHYLSAYAWQLAFPNVSIYAPEGFSVRKKCAFHNGTQFNPVACVAGGEAPMELGGYLGPKALLADKGPFVTHWSEYSSPGPFGKIQGLPAELDDFKVLHFAGDTTSHELLFYHKKTKTLMVADFLYVSNKLTMTEDWTWDTTAKLFAMVMSYRSRSPALPLYRTLRSGLTAAELMVRFGYPVTDENHDIFRDIVNKDSKGSVVDNGADLLGYYNNWNQMKEVIDMLEIMDIDKVLGCHTVGIPEGDWAKTVIKASWGFMYNEPTVEPRCCCLQVDEPEGGVSICQGMFPKELNWRYKCPLVCGVNSSNPKKPFTQCSGLNHFKPWQKQKTAHVRHLCGEEGW